MTFNLVAETPAPAQKATNVEIPVHERKKENSCEICQKSFATLSSKRRHDNEGICTGMYIDNESKKFQFEMVSAVKCKICNGLFIELSDLKRHQALVHEGNT